LPEIEGTIVVSGISFKEVCRHFGSGESRILALDNVSLNVNDEEFVAVVGPSGCGKTTLLRMVAGLDFPNVGEVCVDGRTVVGPGPDRAVVFQQFALFPWKNVRENIAFGLECKRTSRAQIDASVKRYVDLMHLQGRESAYPHQLSGGMQQRVAIARSYALDPAVLLMDEPFGALDAQTRVIMQEELVRLRKNNKQTVLLITHSVEEAVYLADRVVVMTRRPGRVKTIIDVASVRDREKWNDCEHIEQVMDLPSFVHLRTMIWKILREQL
jgi:NitT/TauT family transport system ATP-binding protein